MKIVFILILTSLIYGQDLNGTIEYALSSRSSGNDAYILNESRVQLKYSHEAENSELFFKVDFINDNVLNQSTLFVREAFFTTTPFEWMDLKIGRQIQTWGEGDLVFINDVFQKDWISFFAGRSDDYLKAPSNALRMTIYPEFAGIESADISIMPNSDSDIILQSEGRFQSANPIFSVYQAMGVTVNNPQSSIANLKNTEFALRIKFNSILGFSPKLYAYKGRWNNPVSMKFDGANSFTPYFSKLQVYGFSLRGQALGGIISLETGFYNSVEDEKGSNPFVENSSFRYLGLYETKLAGTDIGIQYYSEIIQDYKKIKKGLTNPVLFPDKDGLRDEVRHLITLRLTQKYLNESLWFTLFNYISPSDEDYYIRPQIRYDYSDNVRFLITGNFFDAFADNDDKTNVKAGLPNYHNTMFGQFKNDQNINLTFKYIF